MLPVVFAARLRNGPSFSHLKGRFCESLHGISLDELCEFEIYNCVTLKHGFTCFGCNQKFDRKIFKAYRISKSIFYCYSCFIDDKEIIKAILSGKSKELLKKLQVNGRRYKFHHLANWCQTKAKKYLKNQYSFFTLKSTATALERIYQ